MVNEHYIKGLLEELENLDLYQNLLMGGVGNEEKVAELDDEIAQKNLDLISACEEMTHRYIKNYQLTKTAGLLKKDGKPFNEIRNYINKIDNEYFIGRKDFDLENDFEKLYNFVDHNDAMISPEMIAKYEKIEKESEADFANKALNKNLEVLSDQLRYYSKIEDLKWENSYIDHQIASLEGYYETEGLDLGFGDIDTLKDDKASNERKLNYAIQKQKSLDNKFYKDTGNYIEIKSIEKNKNIEKE